MTTSDHKAKGDAPDKAPKGREGSSFGIIVSFFLIGFGLSMAVGWIAFPKLLYSEKQQPFDFNHAIHMDLVDEGCESCHLFREDGTYAGVPTLDQCSGCHEDAQSDSPDEEIFVNEYVANQQEVPWLIYSKQPDCVFFSHAVHVKTAEMECAECHGDIGTSESLKVYRENRITGYSQDIWGANIAGLKKNTWDRMKMDDCGSCHLERMGSKGPCFQCHK
ncbi:MAG: cytochrome c family protein [Proteobacteria bacterium]|nr:cytochrome c family protein [Pseudomonadota bacterium]